MESYVDKLNTSGRHTNYGYDLGRRYYYIYLDYYTGFDVSIHEMLKTRKEGGFTDAWVRIMPDLSPTIRVADDAVKKKMDEEKIASPNQVVSAVPVVPQLEFSVPPAIEPDPILSSTITTEPLAQKVAPVPRTFVNTPVYLSLIHSRNGKEVEGEIEVVDTERSRIISKVEGNSYLTLPDPKSKSGGLTLVCNAFGYRKLQHEVNFKNAGDTLPQHVILMDSFYMVTFDLIRYHKGDIATLYNVYFYNDAAIMLPESIFELNKLLQMLQENPEYKIRLHGHTNGNARGKIIKLGPSNNFFALTDDVKNEIGSAKDLSRERAQVIKDWLVSEGIGANRMEIKAWGGGRMIHERESANAKMNVRVEVEVLEE
ncbi:MAG: OmpA family protein [Bacteroidia bacterium]|nr:OmpA family protein [Bacteroidia bacterium]